MFSLRAAVIGGTIAALLTWVMSFPLVFVGLLLFLLSQCTAVIGDAVINGPTMGEEWIPQMIEVKGLVQGPHMAAKQRQGMVITMKVHNKSGWQHTPAIGENDAAPLYMGCRISGDLFRDGQLLGHYSGRGLAFPIAWKLGADGNVAYPVLRPGQTMDIDFSTTVDWDFQPLHDDEEIEDCIIGADKRQALLAVGISIADRNRGAVEHFPMSSVTSAGRDAGYQPE